MGRLEYAISTVTLAPGINKDWKGRRESVRFQGNVRLPSAEPRKEITLTIGTFQYQLYCRLRADPVLLQPALSILTGQCSA
jgi:hypothetical protein